MSEQHEGTIFNYWGKADLAYPLEQHPLVYHSLDVAAVGVALEW